MVDYRMCFYLRGWTQTISSITTSIKCLSQDQQSPSYFESECFPWQQPWVRFCFFNTCLQSNKSEKELGMDSTQVTGLTYHLSCANCRVGLHLHPMLNSKPVRCLWNGFSGLSNLLKVSFASSTLTFRSVFVKHIVKTHWLLKSKIPVAIRQNSLAMVRGLEMQPSSAMLLSQSIGSLAEKKQSWHIPPVAIIHIHSSPQACAAPRNHVLIPGFQTSTFIPAFHLPYPNM